jgi:hypothetical protein
MKQKRKLPDPGSKAAIAKGCTCPVMDNADMKGTGYFVISRDCPVHCPKTERVFVVNEKLGTPDAPIAITARNIEQYIKSIERTARELC